jgi:hypothetical protein
MYSFPCEQSNNPKDVLIVICENIMTTPNLYKNSILYLHLGILHYNK